jgi:hypothetical protein
MEFLDSTTSSNQATNALAIFIYTTTSVTTA